MRSVFLGLCSLIVFSCQAMEYPDSDMFDDATSYRDRADQLFAVINEVRSNKITALQKIKNLLDTMRGDSSFLSQHAFLHYAAGYKMPVEVAKLLLTAGALCDVCNRDGATPLHIAAINDNVGVAQLLLKKGASIDVQDKTGKTPLHQAINHINYAVVKVLLKTRSKLDVQDNDGNTSLHYAVLSNSPAMVRLLLKAGADPDIVNAWGKTSHDMVNPRLKDGDRIRKMLRPATTFDRFWVFLFMELLTSHYSKL